MLLKLKLWLTSVLLLSGFLTVLSQSDQVFFADLIIRNGYKNKVSGQDFSYHSSIPSAKECMLIRAVDGNSFLEWETETIESDPHSEFLTFAWLAGIGSSPGLASFDLYVNDNKMFTFWTDGRDSWQYLHESGASLRFQKDMIDQHGDRFGFMYLTVPLQNEMRSKSLRIKVKGNAFGKTSWYMTFKFPLEADFYLKAMPAVNQVAGENRHLCVAGVLHNSKPVSLQIIHNQEICLDTMISFGYNYLKFFIRAVEKTSIQTFIVKIDNQSFTREIELSPVKKWQVNFVQHSHTDIGYTRSQSDILSDQIRYLDYALDYCDQTDDYPDAAKFRWTCEASWATEQFLLTRPASQIERFVKRVKEGRIELTACYFNFSDLPDEQVIKASLEPVRTFQQHNLPVKTAMQNDVNGIAWSLIDLYSDLGVEYVNMGTHGHRALICFDQPTIFWWQAKSGKKMLAYRAEHYMLGNTRFKIHASDFDVFEDELLSYLIELEAKKYPYDLISIQHSGFLVDNSPPSIHASEMIRLWNEKYDWPKLQTATSANFFESMKKLPADSFQTYKAAWPDWWTDGFGASAREVATIRKAQKMQIANLAGISMIRLLGAHPPKGQLEKAKNVNEALLFYTEHTVGYHSSVREPFHKYTMEQRSIKESYAWEAIRKSTQLREDLMGSLQENIGSDTIPLIAIFNPNSFKNSAQVFVYIDHQTLPRFTSFDIVDDKGQKAIAQAFEYHSDGTYWKIFVQDVPAFGYKKYRIIRNASPFISATSLEKQVPQSFENNFYSAEFDLSKGTIKRLIDKELDEDFIDVASEWGFGEVIHEKLGNREQMESFHLNNYRRNSPSKVTPDAIEHGPLYTAIRFLAETELADPSEPMIIEYRFYHQEKRIDLYYHINKKLTTEPEGIYIAMPFKLSQGRFGLDVHGGEIEPGVDQLPGSSNDWNTVQSYVRLYNDLSQILVLAPDAPLVQFGGINTGRYQAGAKPESTHLYGWPMNNYWTTNFNADQHGGHEWTYTISSGKDAGVPSAIKKSMQFSGSMPARVLPAAKKSGLPEASLLSGWPDNILLVATYPGENEREVIFHVRELTGMPTKLELYSSMGKKMLKIKKTNLLGNPLKSKDIIIKPYETTFYKSKF